MNLPPLPPLPEPKPGCLIDRHGWVTQVGHYADDTLRTYAEQYGRLCAEAAEPIELFQGWDVLNALTPQAKSRTSAENVGDVLDAVVRLIRARSTR